MGVMIVAWKAVRKGGLFWWRSIFCVTGGYKSEVLFFTDRSRGAVHSVYLTRGVGFLLCYIFVLDMTLKGRASAFSGFFPVTLIWPPYDNNAGAYIWRLRWII